MLHPQSKKLQKLLSNSQNGALIHMATGSGKTFNTFKCIVEILKKGQRVIYITPLRAQAEELFNVWSEKLTSHKVGIYTGEFESNKLPVLFKDAQLMIMTPERLDACTRFWRNHWSWIPQIKLLVIDEIHLLADIKRGARLEGAISRFRRLNPLCRFIGLTATIGNPSELASWLQIETFQSSWRPIPLNWHHITFKNIEDKKKQLIDLLLNESSQSIIFVQSRRKAEELSATLKEAKISSAHHHAGLEKKKRENVESDFRQNIIQTLVCTPTLEMGVNLPAGHVFIYDAQQYDGFNFFPITTNSAWQRAGRAGRPGLDTKAVATIFTPEWNKKIDHILNGEFEPINSSMAVEANLAEQIVAEVSSGFAKDKAQLNRNLNLYFQKKTLLQAKTKRLINEMLEAEMLVEFKSEKTQKGLQLRATKLGKLASRNMLQPSTVLLFKKTLDSYGSFTIFDCFIAICSSNDCEPIIPMDFELLTKLQVELRTKQSMLLQENEQRLFSILSIQGKRLINALYMACMLDNYCKGISIQSISDNWECYPYELQRLIESSNRLTKAFIGCTAGETNGSSFILDHLSTPNKLRLISNMLQSGLPAETASLTFIDGIGPNKAKKLFCNGIKDLENLANSELNEISEIQGVSDISAERWIKSALELIDKGFHYQLEEWQPTASLDYETNFDIDIYRLLRSKELKVKKLPESRFRVTGGSEPHFLRMKNKTLLCDCIDFKNGHKCKHILAVKAYLKDPIVLEEIMKLQDKSKDLPKLSLKNIWSSDLAQSERSWR